MVELGAQLNEIHNLYMAIVMIAPAILLTMMVLLEIHLMTTQYGTIYWGTLILIYGYFLLSCIVFYFTVQDEIDGLDTTKWTCIDS